MMPFTRGITILLMGLLLPLSTLKAGEVEELYQQHCASCHHAKRLGSIGPALLPGNLKRLRKPAAVKVISNGRVATQMPAFGDQLDEQQIAALAEYIYTPSSEKLDWSLADIQASHIQHSDSVGFSDSPV